MGIYLIGFLAILGIIATHGLSAALRFCFCGFFLCGLVALLSLNHPITAAYREAVATHGYFFLSEWRWYEVMGLIAPVILMGIVYSRSGLKTAMGKLAAASALMGATCFLSALCFVHAAHPGLLARVQLLRGFDSVYCVGAVMLGGFLIDYFWSRGVWAGIGCFAVAFIGMALADNQSYPQSRRIELPGIAATNPWEQAFLWIRENTPTNAVFAADSTALPLRDEEAQGFRAISERSVLDGAKDPGVVAIFPALAPDWAKYQTAERGLDQASDSQRIRRLRPYGVTWVLLDAGAKTSLPCPYRNSAVEVCLLEQRG
jgi:hypothetical protein